MSKITKNIFLGSDFDAKNLKKLKKFNISAIVISARVLSKYHKKHFKYFQFEIADTPETLILHHWLKAFKFMDRFIKKNLNVFVHCMLGVSRSSVTVIAYLMYSERISYYKALD